MVESCPFGDMKGGLDPCGAVSLWHVVTSKGLQRVEEGNDMEEGQCKKRGAIIVHPDFTHTLSDPPECTVVIAFHSLPLEVVHLVCQHLGSAKDLCNVQAVNREFRRIASDDLLWRPLCQKLFNVPGYAQPDSWKELYRFNHNVFRELFLQSCMEQVDALGGGPIQLPAGALHF